jgi:nicotinate-nucleotide adenylyltransferase
LPDPDAAAAEPLRIGLLGGTFDPPHIGHLAIAQRCRAVLDLERVLLVVANDPWQKSADRSITPAEDRFAMVEAAVAGIGGIEASRLEIDRGGPSYTIDTVEEVAAALPAQRPAEIFLIIGADLVETLGTWERPHDLAALVTLAIVTRPHHLIGPPAGWRSVLVAGIELDVSSSEVRAQLLAGESVDDLVPDPVIHCISRRNLYAGR